MEKLTKTVLTDFTQVVRDGADEFAWGSRSASDLYLKSLFYRYFKQCRHWEGELHEKSGETCEISDITMLDRAGLTDKGHLIRCLNWQSSALGSYACAMRCNVPLDIRLLLQHHRIMIEEGYRQLSHWQPVPASLA